MAQYSKPKARFTIYVTCHFAGVIAQLYVRIDLSSIPATLLRAASTFMYIVNLALVIMISTQVHAFLLCLV